MKYELFEERFLDSVRAARDFARTFILEPLPDACIFHLHLNQSCDGNASSDVALFPEDSAPEVARRLKHLSADRVVENLFRNEKVPEWVNLNVVGETGVATLIDVLACGRFTADEARLYHRPKGRAPFHVLGPVLPVDYVEGQKFSIYERSSCWTEQDLSRITTHSADVWSLELNGPAFSDETLASHPGFENLEILELRGTRVSGSGLRVLERLPRLRVLRLHVGDGVEALDLCNAPASHTLTTLTLAGLPGSVRGVATLANRFPRLAHVSLASTSNVTTDGELQLPSVSELSLTFPQRQQWVRVPASAASLSLHYTAAYDTEVALDISAAKDSLTSINLRGTPVSDAIFATLRTVPGLQYVDLVDTRISQALLEDFGRERNLRNFHPRA